VPAEHAAQSSPAVPASQLLDDGVGEFVSSPQAKAPKATKAYTITGRKTGPKCRKNFMREGSKWQVRPRPVDSLWNSPQGQKHSKETDGGVSESISKKDVVTCLNDPMIRRNAADPSQRVGDPRTKHRNAGWKPADQSCNLANPCPLTLVSS